MTDTGGPLRVFFAVTSTCKRGQALSVGVVVFDGNVVHDTLMVTSKEGLESISITDVAHAAIIPHLKGPSVIFVPTNKDMRTTFFHFYMKYKTIGNTTMNRVEFWTDVPYPTETRFLDQLVRDYPERDKHMPYPLYDVATVIGGSVKRSGVTFPIVNNMFDYDPKECHNPIGKCIASFQAFMYYGTLTRKLNAKTSLKDIYAATKLFKKMKDKLRAEMSTDEDKYLVSLKKQHPPTSLKESATGGVCKAVC